jgi:hypothetical protein
MVDDNVDRDAHLMVAMMPRSTTPCPGCPLMDEIYRKAASHFSDEQPIYFIRIVYDLSIHHHIVVQNGIKNELAFMLFERGKGRDAHVLVMDGRNPYELILNMIEKYTELARATPWSGKIAHGVDVMRQFSRDWLRNEWIFSPWILAIAVFIGGIVLTLWRRSKMFWIIVSFGTLLISFSGTIYNTINHPPTASVDGLEVTLFTNQLRSQYFFEGWIMAFLIIFISLCLLWLNASVSSSNWWWEQTGYIAMVLAFGGIYLLVELFGTWKYPPYRSYMFNK